MLGIVDYGMGNIFSILNATKSVGFKSELVKDPSKFKDYNSLILPGVGAFHNAVEKFNDNDLVEYLNEFKKTGKYIIGICLGMQLIMEKSYEFGEHEGLGYIRGDCIRFPKNVNKKKLLIPHISWNKISFNDYNSTIFKGVKNLSFMYFVHSYFCDLKDESYIMSKTNYHGFEFCSSLKMENIIGLQFHPEKSGVNGLKILSNIKKIIY
jgi:imidazole glycerol-phosphate synthase subunit HisH